ncbi:tetratricopeptide repeat protein [Anseongella ginsenosidimutans]|uniref:Tetratricopeptide repeat protein n=1 Tax=Anseongella ginsenosidimutans TaxID=496056 RepID=A0A4R3KV28_9SPHI|nr:tetratricopeptide repeat protein [Anseongella ginsenosidimutans]QEC53344.1 tetratricopeptide repeat protein [Anseongella ginsenosidimutans]TCS88229.1 tetratricopeptide repeat protein [Anseongella ginsenosidimutans]
MKNTRLEQLREFLLQQPQDPFLKYALATEYLKLGDTTNALLYFEGLIKEHEEYLGTYYHLGKLYEQLGRIPDAAETYARGIALAQQQRNQHTLSELRGALLAISDEEEGEN